MSRFSEERSPLADPAERIISAAEIRKRLTNWVKKPRKQVTIRALIIVMLKYAFALHGKLCVKQGERKGMEGSLLIEKEITPGI